MPLQIEYGLYPQVKPTQTRLHFGFYSPKPVYSRVGENMLPTGTRGWVIPALIISLRLGHEVVDFFLTEAIVLSLYGRKPIVVEFAEQVSLVIVLWK
jgi:hypothetical protein